METTLTKSKSIKIKNILNISKYTFRTLRIMYLIEAVILVLALGSSSFLSKFTLGFDLIPAISLLLIINFIAHIIIFSMQLSKEYGRLLFLTPISGIDFILGNLLELILTNSFIVIISNLNIMVNSNNMTSMIFSISLSILFGIIIGYLIITALIAILGSYIKSTALCVLAVIATWIIGDIIYSFISNLLLLLFPYWYITIGKYGAIEVDIFSMLINLIALITLQLIAANRIDRKLDIV
ncbi:MAG: hypothetical protein ACLSV2_07475 [Clostridium sp.]